MKVFVYIKRHFFLSIFVALFISSCAGPSAYENTGNPETNWSPNEILRKTLNMTHHWGQKGEILPNNGWSTYSSLKLDLGGKQKRLLKQHGKEFSAMVINKDNDLIELRVISIPNAGTFYAPKDTSDCSPDTIESIGLSAELSLFFISQAFPNGPSSVVQSTTKKVRGGPASVRFLQGMMNIKSSWNVEVRVKTQGHSKYHFQIFDENQNLLSQLDWDGNPQDEIITNNEPLEQWLACWFGSSGMKVGGTKGIDKRYTRYLNMKNFGQVRVEARSFTPTTLDYFK